MATLCNNATDTDKHQPLQLITSVQRHIGRKKKQIKSFQRHENTMKSLMSEAKSYEVEGEHPTHVLVNKTKLLNW